MCIKSVHCYKYFLTTKQSNMKRLSTLAAVVILVMTACNNKTEEKKEMAKPVAEVKKPVSLPPYKAMMVQHSVKDYDVWYKGFAGHDSLRQTYGLTDAAVGRGLDDDKSLVVLTRAADVQKAKDFAASPGLKAAMKKSGVTGKPTVSYLDVIYDDTSHIAQSERVMVTHHVKDFDAWKKVFDTESDSVRAANGFIERALARGVDDPNTVTILFAVTDMAKAKARVGSEDLKKIMTDAGVDGPPTITWFKWVAGN